MESNVWIHALFIHTILIIDKHRVWCDTLCPQLLIFNVRGPS